MLVPKLRFSGFQQGPQWEEKRLSQVCEVNPPAKKLPEKFIYIDLESVEAGALLQKKIISMEEAPSRAQRLLKEGDVIFQMVRPYQKNNYLFQSEGNYDYVASTGYAQLRAHQSNMYLFQYLHNERFVDRVLAKCTGSNYPAINSRALSQIAVEIPDSNEQQKIADCLSSIDELIAAQTQKLDALKAHKKGLMQQLFPAEGETVPKLRFPEFRDAGEWGEDTLVQAAKFRRGSFPQPYGLPEWYDEVNGMPFIQVFDVSDDLRLKPKTKSKISKLASKQSVFIPKGTVIITIQGSIGRVAITQYDAYIDRTLLLFEEFFMPLEKVFFAYVLQLLFEIEKQKAPGGIIKTITKEVLSDFKIKTPRIEEQQKIADCLSSVDELITVQTQKIDALKAHKKGLMQQLFPSVDELGA